MTNYQHLIKAKGVKRVHNLMNAIGVPYSTYHSWDIGRRNPPEYLPYLIDMVLDLQSTIKDYDSDISDLIHLMGEKSDKLERAQDYLHDGRIREAMAIIDNL